MTEKNLYERLGGALATAVIDHFSDAGVQSPIVRKTSTTLAPKAWRTKTHGSLHGDEVTTDSGAAVELPIARIG